MPAYVEGRKDVYEVIKEAYGLYRIFNQSSILLNRTKFYSLSYPVAQYRVIKRYGISNDLFNYGRTEKDGYYSGCQIGDACVIIHEVGHNFFPIL